MKTNSMIILFIMGLALLVSYILMSSLMIAVAFIGASVLFLYILQRNNIHRKENLNIIRDDNKLYFYLSDDLLFSTDLLRNKSTTETIRDSITKEMSTLKDMARQICFINFKDESLLTELNYALRFRESKHK
jgi:membrane-bound ClpP family serine protease